MAAGSRSRGWDRGRGVGVAGSGPGQGRVWPQGPFTPERAAGRGGVLVNNFVFPFPPRFVRSHVRACDGAENKRTR